MELVHWLEERAANCRRIADMKHGEDRAGWMEDEAYFRLAVTAIDQCMQVRWRDVSEELPQEAQEVLFVRDGKTVHGAWIGGIFWHSNQKMAAAKWMPLPLPPNTCWAARCETHSSCFLRSPSLQVRHSRHSHTRHKRSTDRQPGRTARCFRRAGTHETRCFPTRVSQLGRRRYRVRSMPQISGLPGSFVVLPPNISINPDGFTAGYFRDIRKNVK